VLHIATVHYGSPQWIEIQTRHLREQVSVPYTTWTSLEGIDPCYARHFDRVVDQAGTHAGKLNHLAVEIAGEAAPEDLLMFLDGDAFPIADPMPRIREGLRGSELLAVRRAENVGDRQPHPCFCVTTVGAWRALGGDWSAGYRWLDEKGRRVTDVGGNLLRILELTGTSWTELTRSNRRNLDPVFFGVYGEVVYHHGAGFRDSELTRAHYTLAPAPRPLPATPLLRRVVRRRNHLRQQAWERDTKRALIERSRAIYERIQRGDETWLSELV
jgi:hypothetical protein